MRCLSSTQFRRTLPTREPYPPPGRPPTSACAHAQALARRTSWWPPGDLAAFAPSPPGKKNSRGASRLRQIKGSYNLSPQVRRGVTGRRRMSTVAPVRRGRLETVLGCVLSPRDLPRRQPRQTPQAARCVSAYWRETGPSNKAWMSQPCRSSDVAVASTSSGPGTGGAGVTEAALGACATPHRDTERLQADGDTASASARRPPGPYA